MARRVLCFRVGARRWALPLEAVREILEGPSLLTVPRSRPQVAGMVLRGGVLIPVYDVLPASAPPPSHVVVLDWADMLNGLRVAEPDAQLPVGEEPGGDSGLPCSGVLRLRSHTAERVDLAALYRMLEIPA